MALFFVLAFIIELIAFIGFASASLLLPLQPVFQIIIGVILFIALITFWGIFMSPRASKKFGKKHYYLAKVVIYTIASVTIVNFWGMGFGLLFIATALVDEIVLLRFTQHDRYYKKTGKRT